MAIVRLVVYNVRAMENNKLMMSVVVLGLLLGGVGFWILGSSDTAEVASPKTATTTNQQEVVVSQNGQVVATTTIDTVVVATTSTEAEVKTPAVVTTPVVAPKPAVIPKPPEPAPTPTPTPAPILPSGITMAEVRTHDDATSCWSAIDGMVYDLTAYIPKHPGGEREILSICGEDGSKAFEGQHSGESKPERILASYKIGDLSN